MAINAKHRRFINEYLKHMNATKAYMKVYKDASYDTARANSAELLAKTSIRQEIDNRLKAMQLSTDEALKILADHAKGSLEEFTDDEGNIDLSEVRKAGLMHLIKEIEIIETDGEKSSSRRQKIKLHDPQGAIDKILRVKGLYKDNLNVNVKKIIKVSIRKDE